MHVFILLVALVGAFALRTEAAARGLTQVSVGATAVCLLDEQGRIQCWGNPAFTQLPSVSDGREFTQVSVGGHFACALRTDGTVECWGRDEIERRTPSELFVQVSVGGAHACGVRADGILRCWGADSLGQTQVPPIEDFIQVAAGGAFTCGLRANGAVVCWGDDSQHQLDAPAEPFTEISAGAAHVCGITQLDSQVICWGRSIGALDERMTAAFVVAPEDRAQYPASQFVQPSAGFAHTCTLDAMGYVACWGDNTFGQRDAPIDQTFVQISAGMTETCGITQGDGRLVCWGQPLNPDDP